MNQAFENFLKIRNEIHSPQIQVVAVTKGQSSGKIRDFLISFSNSSPPPLGENYLEEFESKVHDLKEFHQNLKWHFLGRLQSRKIPKLLELASVFHGVCRIKELELMAPHLPGSKSFEGFYVQVNISDELRKSGLDFHEVPMFLERIRELQLERYFLGFMGMASEISRSTPDKVKSQFDSLRAFRDQYSPGKALSMGMSSDYRLAIEAGSQVIRLGTLIFGAR